MTVSVEEWRGVAAETTDDVPARLSMLLRKRTRRLLGDDAVAAQAAAVGLHGRDHRRR